MDWGEAWAWFSSFSEFFVIVFGPVILAGLPLLMVAGILTGLFTSLIDMGFGLFFGGKNA